MLRFADARFPMIFYVKPLVPLELQERFRIGPLGWGLYGLEFWDKRIGKVLNINWHTAGRCRGSSPSNAATGNSGC